MTMNKFTTLACSLIAVTGATAASAQVLGDTAGQATTSVEAKGAVGVDPQTTLERVEQTQDRVSATADQATDTAKDTVDAATASAIDALDSTAERAEGGVQVDAGAHADHGMSASAPGAEVSANAKVDAEADADVDSDPEG